MKTYNGGIRHMRLFTIGLCAFLLCSFAAQATINGTFSVYSRGLDNDRDDLTTQNFGAIYRLDLTVQFGGGSITGFTYNIPSTATTGDIDVEELTGIAVVQDDGNGVFDLIPPDTLVEAFALTFDSSTTITFTSAQSITTATTWFFALQSSPSDRPESTDRVFLQLSNFIGTNITIPPFDNSGQDLSLPVLLSNFSAKVSGSDIAIQWRTEYEENNIGFNVYRGETPKGPFEKVNAAIIRGAGTDATPRDYQFVDETAEPQKTYYYYLEDVDFSGDTNRSKLLVVDLVTRTLRPLKILKTQLRQNFPNPFNPETWFAYDLDAKAKVTIDIYDIKSRLIRELDLGEQAPGSYITKSDAAYWDGKDQVGATASSGIYFYTFKAGNFSATRKMIILK
jgi:hypothetical protein